MNIREIIDRIEDSFQSMWPYDAEDKALFEQLRAEFADLVASASASNVALRDGRDELHRKHAAKLISEKIIIKEQRDELLSALQAVVAVWDDIYPDMESGKYPQERLEYSEFTEMQAARAAIAKAASYD